MNQPAIWWVGRDARLADNPALTAAAAAGPVIPVAILDTPEARLGAAAAWRLAQSLASLDADLKARGSRLTIRRGAAGEVLAALRAETGAGSVHVNDPHPFFAVPDGAGVTVHPGNALRPPGTIFSGAGTPYRKFTPFWKVVRTQDIAAPLPVPSFAAPAEWPAGEDAGDLGRAMNRGAEVLARTVPVGETAANDRLAAFLDEAVGEYAEDRNRPDRPMGTSRLSDHLATGEISARTIWHAAQGAMQQGARGAEHFLSELGWREFARDLFFHDPQMETREWNLDWRTFAWRPDGAEAELWRRGLTGIDMVDAGMRELFAMGRMHNRVRMIVASYLIKHMLTDWRVGLRWFDDTLVDWDPASNAMNWQWVAGSGPDAAPYFRVFNPDTQAEKFDPHGDYRRYWLTGEGDALFRAAIPRSWDIPRTRPAPVVPLNAGREAALAAYHAARSGRAAGA